MSHSSQPIEDLVSSQHVKGGVQCWICLQEERKVSTKFGRMNYLRSFTPCSCKGTLSFVHPDCINRYVGDKYRALAEESGCGDNTNESLQIKGVKPSICCPNCRTPYNYMLLETTRVGNFRLDSIEKTSLLILLLLQSIILLYDIFHVFRNRYLYLNDPWGNYHLIASHVIHLLTVAIVLTAGGVNFLEALFKSTKVVVQDKRRRVP